MKNFLLKLFPLCLLFLGCMTLTACGGDDDDDDLGPTPGGGGTPTAVFTFKFEDTYYLWDAKQWYWYGISNYPTVVGQKKDNYPLSQSSDPDRWYNTDTYKTNSSNSGANYSAKFMPCYNAMTWYLTDDIYWDETTVWSLGGTNYTGGIWVKKFDKISGHGLSTISCDNASGKTSKSDLLIGKPSDTSDYFFLPALGSYDDGKLDYVGKNGYYWTSSCTDTTGSYCSAMLIFRKNPDPNGEWKATVELWSITSSDNCVVAGSRPGGESWFQ